MKIIKSKFSCRYISLSTGFLLGLAPSLANADLVVLECMPETVMVAGDWPAFSRDGEEYIGACADYSAPVGCVPYMLTIDSDNGAALFVAGIRTLNTRVDFEITEASTFTYSFSASESNSELSLELDRSSLEYELTTQSSIGSVYGIKEERGHCILSEVAPATPRI